METLYVKIGLAIIFALSVVGKLTGKTRSTFEKAGFGRELMYATAVAEVVLTVALFTKYEFVATLGLLAIIGGAVVTLLRQKAKPSQFVVALIAAILLIVLLWIFRS